MNLDLKVIKAIFRCNTISELFGIYLDTDPIEHDQLYSVIIIQDEVDSYNKYVLGRASSIEEVSEVDLTSAIRSVESEIDDLKKELIKRATIIDEPEDVLDSILEVIDKDEEAIFELFVHKK